MRRLAIVRLAAPALGLSCLALLAATRADALPRYSARYEQKCSLCHVNPSGGGLRNEYASERLVPDEIAWRRSKPAILNTLDSTFSKFLLIGTDFREMYVGSDVSGGQLNFFQMQGDLYLNFQIDPSVSIYYDRGRSDSYEMFGLGYLTPHVYAKAGRFVPSYGWKFDDHTMFVRDLLGLAPPSNSDVGFEAGYEPGAVGVQASVVNGSRGNILDNDTRVAEAINLVARHHIGPFGGGLGASGYHAPSDSSHFDTYGGYGYLTWRSLTWVGEADLVRRKPNGGDATLSLVSSHELTWRVRQGLEVKATYDYFDPDRDADSGTKSRWGGGVSFMPYPYVVLEGLLRRTNYESLAGVDAWESVAQLHLFR
jgi:hypothetical protein